MINMTSSINAAVSTTTSEAQAGRDIMETQQSVPIDSVPVLDLPHRWDEDGELIPGSSPAPCPRCKWSGDPEYLFFHEKNSFQAGKFYGLDCQDGPFACFRCEILRLLLCQTAKYFGYAMLDTTSVSIVEGRVGYICNLQGIDNVEQQIFLSEDLQSSTIDKYNITRRCMVSTGARWARDLISECMSSHQECPSQIDGKFLPTRLINIQPDSEGGNPRLKLQSSRAVPAGSPYVALSYCWGDYKPPCMTTNLHGNADDNLRSLLWDDLPKTFQDAVKFTLALGVKFLWIDSICIIQGDSEDWNSEAPNMNSVYKNSYVTLAALCGRDSRHGLQTCSMKETLSPVVQLRVEQSTHILYARPCHYLDDRIRDEADPDSPFYSRYPLLLRAWTYQERLVSSRVIFLTESEMIYQCLCHVTCECGSEIQDYYPQEDKPYDLKKRKIGLATQGVFDNSTKYEHGARIWRHDVVTEYSALVLSDPRDRLPAIGAIAEQFQASRVGDQYLAGLWSNTLLEDLLWICQGFFDRNFAFKEALERYAGLPTWSWASVRSPVYYNNFGPVVHKAKVVHAHCNYTNNKTFGTLENSQLQLQGRVLVCMLEWVGVPDEEDRLNTRLSFKDKNGWRLIQDPHGSIYPGSRGVDIMMDCDQDGLQCVPPQQVVHLMEISVGRSMFQKWWRFLLLRLEAARPGKVLGTEAYTRGGTVRIAQSLGFSSDGSLLVEGSYTESSMRGPNWFDTVMKKHSERKCCEIR